MLKHLRLRCHSVISGLLVGLSWVTPTAAQAQQSILSPYTPVPVVETEAESPWAKVPYPWPPSKSGWFLLPPMGEGYYTALDLLQHDPRDKPAPYPYRTSNGSFFDSDFRYLDQPGSLPALFFDRVKRIPLWPSGSAWGHNLELTLGGEERVVIKNEIGGANARLGGLDNNYDLLRSRIYGDLWFRDLFRVYLEYLDAESFNQDLPPISSDQAHSQLLNAFIDVKLGSIMDSPVYARAGRMEMIYGSQRLLSSPDWSNVRRSYDGTKLFWHSDKLDVDAFWLRPVNNFPSASVPDLTRQFAGIWSTYRPTMRQTFDAYYLYLDSDLPVAFGLAPGGRSGYDTNTFGGRWSGNHRLGDILEFVNDSALTGDILWDFEGAYQFGTYSDRPIRAGMATAGLGYHFKNLPLQPQFWAYYDYASGTPNRDDKKSTFETFNQLFPAGHTYFGFLDEVGRENIHDLNFQASVYPIRWITSFVQYHIFRLDQAGDALYGATPGYPTARFDPTARAGTNVGRELDVVISFQLDRHNSIVLGYSKLYSGDFIRQTGVNTNPEMFYMQYYFRW